MDRRTFLRATGIGGIGAFLGGAPLSAAAAPTTGSPLLDFEAVPASTRDTVVVPRGYRTEVLISWGDPLFADAPPFDPSGRAGADAQARQFGDNTDGMTLFPLDEDRAVMAVNNEYTNLALLFDHGGEAMDAEAVRKSQAAHGVSIFEITRDGERWKVDRAGRLNRRITAYTPMELTGPAAGDARMKTAADPGGRRVLGTFNNCANGRTPWGTYLTCEENFNKYFGATEATETDADQRRYGIRATGSRYQWEAFDERFDITLHPNEANRFGWVVEIDPMDPTSTPKKRTALGRFKHENAALTLNNDGRVVVYMGDDERGEHLYRFISNGRYDPADPKGNRELLDEGTLYVARFDGAADALKGEGRWIELSHGKNGLTADAGFANQAEVLINARRAATAVGATTMDRPEWVAVHPDGRTVYSTLTNNKHRGVKPGHPLNGPNPRIANRYGQIVRWRPADGDHTADRFQWDLFVLAGNPTVHSDARRGTPNVTADNLFNSPDGLGFDPAGRLWIMTDGNYSNRGDFAGMGNNQMLCADPAGGEIRRFLTGPLGCEVTGLCFSADHRTMFVGIQHPGERGPEQTPSHFPAGGDSVPRSSIVMVRREDGGSFAE